jgi:hypothetical protein
MNFKFDISRASYNYVEKAPQLQPWKKNQFQLVKKAM